MTGLLLSDNGGHPYQTTLVVAHRAGSLDEAMAQRERLAALLEREGAAVVGAVSLPGDGRADARRLNGRAA